MSLINPIECGTEYSFLNILKKIVKKDSEGNYYVGAYGLDVTAPYPVSAEIGAFADNVVVITFNEQLDPLYVPAAGSFLTPGYHWGYSPDTVAIIGNKLYLTITGNDAFMGDDITVWYTQPAVNGLRDLYGNLCASFVSFPVTNTISPCAEFLVYIAAMTTPPTGDDYIYLNAFIQELIVDGLWAEMDVIYLHAIHNNGTSEALINMKNPGTFDATNTSGATWTQYEGFTGDGLAKYIMYNWTPSADAVKFALTDNCQILYLRNNITVNQSTKGHGVNGSADTKDLFLCPRRDTNECYIRNNENINASGVSTDSSGFWVNRRTGTTKQLYRNCVQLISTIRNTTGLPTHKPYGLATNDDDVAAGFTTNQIALKAYGAYIDDNQMLDFMWCIERYMDHYGKGVIP